MLALAFVFALGVMISPVVCADDFRSSPASSHSATQVYNSSDKNGSAAAANTRSPSPELSFSPDDAEDRDDTMFYAFLEGDNKPGNGPLYDFLRGRPGAHFLLGPHTRMEHKVRPLMQWRRFADRRQRFVPAFLFLFGVSFLYWFIFPGTMQTSAEECKRNFWKSFGTGLLLAIIVLSLMRTAFLTQFGWPFGILLAGTVQAAVLAGLAVAIYDLGHAIILLSGVKNLPFFSSRPKLLRACDIFAGALLSALILQIPGAGVVPRVGTRLLSLFGLLGVGAICRVIKNRQSV